MARTEQQWHQRCRVSPDEGPRVSMNSVNPFLRRMCIHCREGGIGKPSFETPQFPTLWALARSP